jgi:hypothetical protein
VGLLVGLVVLVSNGVAGGSTLVTGGHGMCCGVWPLGLELDRVVATVAVVLLEMIGPRIR